MRTSVDGPFGDGEIAMRHRAFSGSDARAPWLTALRTIAIVAVVVVISATSIAAIAAWRLTSQLASNAVDISNGTTIVAPTIGEFSGSFNILLVGADNAPGQKGWGENRDATLNDVNILVHVADDHKSAVVMSIPRDLVIPQPECVDPKSKFVYSAESAQPMNTAFARGGLGCVVATVHSLTGITIPYAALFTFQGTVDMADAVGGVPICLTAAVNDPDSGLNLPKGRSVVSGRTALAYLRDRHGVGDGSDLARISSQQAYMSSLMRKMTSSSTLTNPTTLYGLASAAAKSVTLSKSLADPDTMVTMMLAMKGVPLDHMVFVQYPTGADPENPNKVVPNPELASILTTRIQKDESIALDSSSLGYNAKLTSTAKKTTTKKKGSGTSTSTPSKSAVVDGLRGQTAAQHTCSVAASS